MFELKSYGTSFRQGDKIPPLYFLAVCVRRLSEQKIKRYNDEQRNQNASCGVGRRPWWISAAFRAADLGLEVTLVEARSTLGGVCLNVGCIPSKALLHVAKVIDDARDMASHGVTFGTPEIDLDKIRAWKDKVVGQLTNGLAGMSKMRKVKVVNGYGKFTGANTLQVGDTTITFDQAIIAAGSEPVALPFMPKDDPRVIDSTGALELKDIPAAEMLVLGGCIYRPGNRVPCTVL